MKPFFGLLESPLIWTLTQNVFSSDQGKRDLYRSFIEGKEGRVLDFGCANGNIFPAFSDLEYYGVDINEKFIRYAQKRYSQFPNAHFVCADILTEPFEPEFFDHIILACTGHHLDDESLRNILIALTRLLRKDAAIHFIDPIRTPGEDGFALRLIMGMDQGKFHRSENEYRHFFDSLSQLLLVERTTVYPVKNRGIPNPAGMYMKLTRAESGSISLGGIS
jgi:SAM-dependent methyltransferase